MVILFVAGDLLWYPVEGDNKLRQAPDVMVVFGRPKGDRGSYKQWEEDNIPPQVVFEILSPGNLLKDMAKKFKFYERYSVEEYYIYDPDSTELIGWLRSGKELDVIEEMNGWVSPRLGVRFHLTSDNLEILSPSGQH
jgi:Uma2 family endonuclease